MNATHVGHMGRVAPRFRFTEDAGEVHLWTSAQLANTVSYALQRLEPEFLLEHPEAGELIAALRDVGIEGDTNGLHRTEPT